jgi:hypothetical protein
MKKYIVLNVTKLMDNRIFIFCSEPTEIDKLGVALNRVLDNLHIAKDGKYQATITVSKGNLREVYGWIVQLFCNDGWEPFGVGEKVLNYSFRKEII